MPIVPVRGVEIYSFYDKKDQPAYNFANYARGRVTVDGIDYKTREHAFHAQKLKPEARQGYAQYSEKLTPEEVRKDIKSYGLPDDWISKRGNRQAMHKVVSAYAKQHPTFATQLDRTGNLPIVEDTAGSKYAEYTWGCGYNGDGKNFLGEVLMQIRAERRGQTHDAALQEAQDLNLKAKKAIMSLGRRHKSLLQDHHEVRQELAQRQAAQLGRRAMQPSVSGTSAASQIAAEIAAGFGERPMLAMVDDPKVRGQKVLKVTFKDPAKAAEFRRFSGISRNQGNHAFLGPNRAPEMLDNLLLCAQAKEQTGEWPTLSRVPDKKDISKKVLQVTFKDPARAANFKAFCGGGPGDGRDVILGPLREKTAKSNLAFLAQIKEQTGEWPTLSRVPDKKDRSKKVLQVTFKDPARAANFKAFCGGGPGDGRDVILGPLREKTAKSNLAFLAQIKEQTGEWPTLSRVPDKKDRSKKVLQVTFKDPARAANFRAFCGGGPGQGRDVILGPNRERTVRNNLGTRVPRIDKLKSEIDNVRSASASRMPGGM